MKRLKQKLRELKAKRRALTRLTIGDLKSEIGAIRAKAYKEELVILSEADDDFEFDSLESSMDELVISEEEVFKQILSEKFTDIENELINIHLEAFKYIDTLDIKILIEDFKIYFVYRNFKSGDYDKVKKHYLKQNNKQSIYRAIVKDRKVYKKQRNILKNLLSTCTDTKTVLMLVNYEFLDEALKNIVKKMYYTLSAPRDNYLHDGVEIRYAINKLQEV